MRYAVPAGLTIACILAATFLPFLPGGYDPLAEPVGRLAWMFGRAGLVLVPVAGLRLWQDRPAARRTVAPGWFTWLTTGACVIVALALVLVGFSAGVIFATIVGTATGLTIRWLLRQLRSPGPRRVPASVTLAVAPLIVLSAQVMLLEPVTERTRGRVIANSAPLIAEIEQYRVRHGVYPQSIFALYGDVKPAVVGVERYAYEPSGASYNVLFEEPSLAFGLRRFVVYNPMDSQRVTVHESDRLRLDDAGLNADNAGFTIVRSLPQPHWKLFSFRS